MSDAHGHGGGHGGGDDEDPPMAPAHGGQHVEEGEAWLISYADLMTLLVGFFVILMSFSKVDEEKMEGVKRAITAEFGGTYHIPYEDMTDRLRQQITKLGMGEQFVIKQNDLGVEISFLGTVFFTPGSADLKPEGAKLLKQLIPAIKAEAADFNVVIEGHTDDNPVGAGLPFRNNWELSSLRACRVLETFYQNGFLKDKMTAVGYGDSKPIVANRDSDGEAIPENQSQNRRVVVKLLKQGESTLGLSGNAPTGVGDQAAPEATAPVPNNAAPPAEGGHEGEAAQPAEGAAPQAAAPPAPAPEVPAEH